MTYPALQFPLPLPDLVSAFDGVVADADGLARVADDSVFTRPAADGGWSAVECIDHLAVATRTYVAAMEAGLAEAPRTAGLTVVHPGFAGRWFVRQLEPPVRRRTRAPKKIVPRAAPPRADAWRAFLEANDAYRGFLRRCEGLDLGRSRFPNPFVPLKFSLATGIAVIVAHHRRHVAQMARVLGQ